MGTRMELNKLIRESLRKYSAYETVEQPVEDGWVKLNTNENPFPPIPEVLNDLKKAINENLRLYPDPTSFELRKEILNVLLRDKDTLTNRNSIFIGNGSDEILDVITGVPQARASMGASGCPSASEGTTSTSASA